jgi:hypothetical protein
MNCYLLARLALFGALLLGCTSWQVQDVAPAQLAASYDAQRVRVTRRDGSQVVIDHARLTRAGVFGEWERTPVAVPMTEIQQLAVRREDPARTIALIGGLVVVAGTAGALAIGGGEAASSLR